MGGFEFAVVASLRAVQLIRGCRPRVDGPHKVTVIAQLEVSLGKVVQHVGTASPDDAYRPQTVVAAPIEPTTSVRAL
jgi:DNA-directed RNA polymerase subunit K/omega